LIQGGEREEKKIEHETGERGWEVETKKPTERRGVKLEARKA
jgi:hypothetical protein